MEYELSRNMRGMKPSIIREILKQMSDPSLISFAGGNPAPESFPNEEIAAASARLLAQDPAGMLQYSVTEGVPAVLEQVRRFANRHELRVRGQDALLLCTGSQQVLDLATKCLCNEGDTIAVEEPAFLGAYNTFRSYGAKLAGVPMEEDGVLRYDVDASPKVELEKEPEPTSTTPPAPTDPRLPYTGQLNWPVPVLTVLGLGLLALGLALRRKSRHG